MGALHLIPIAAYNRHVIDAVCCLLGGGQWLLPRSAASFPRRRRGPTQLCVAARPTQSLGAARHSVAARLPHDQPGPQKRQSPSWSEAVESGSSQHSRRRASPTHTLRCLRLMTSHLPCAWRSYPSLVSSSTLSSIPPASSFPLASSFFSLPKSRHHHSIGRMSDFDHHGAPRSSARSDYGAHGTRLTPHPRASGLFASSSCLLGLVDPGYQRNILPPRPGTSSLPSALPAAPPSGLCHPPPLHSWEPPRPPLPAGR
mmetsp:Transcript_32434/g.61091  ORF Transcript_32434/g.61091 Transcript_32434/m.61091 type:complete len:257 (-) Transcript_32434:394-1164(-)